MSKNHEAISKPNNFGPLPDDHLTVKSLAEKAIAIWGSGEWKDISTPLQPHEAGLLKLDINRAMNELQWLPKLGASSAIEWTINWYKQPLPEKAAFTFQQIIDYLAL